MSMARGLNHLLLQRSRSVGIVLLTLLSLGLVTRPIEAPAWEIVKAGQPEMNLEAIEGSLGQGLVIGVLGGFRAVMADFLWIRTNTIWERRDRVKLDAIQINLPRLQVQFGIFRMKFPSPRQHHKRLLRLFEING